MLGENYQLMPGFCLLEQEALAMRGGRVTVMVRCKLDRAMTRVVTA
jgi:hypothetical protein